MTMILRSTLCAGVFAGAALSAVIGSSGSAAAEDFHTTYATQKGGCAAGPTIAWSPKRLAGPGFQCELGEARPAGTGLVTYEAICAANGTTLTDPIALDLGNDPNRFAVDVPGVGSFEMWPCTPVEGLQGTN